MDSNGYAYIPFGYEFANAYTNIIISNMCNMKFMEIPFSACGYNGETKIVNTEVWITWLAHEIAK
jgi:hypothetical protein